MIRNGAAPGAVFEAAPGTADFNQERREHSAQAEVFNSIRSEPKDYDALLAAVHERRPRLLPAAIDRGLWRLIVARAVKLVDDGSCRWAVRQ